MVEEDVEVITTESSFANLIHTSRSPRETVLMGRRGEVVDLGAVVKSVSSASKEYIEKAEETKGEESVRSVFLRISY